MRPLYPGLPDNPYDELNTPPFFALGASWPDTAPGPQGFAAADGRTIILRDLDGIAAFLAAARKMSATPRALNIVRRIMWLYQADPANRLIENHPRLAAVRPPQIAWSPDGGLDATWFVERGGQTGWIGVFRADFHFMPGEKPHYSEIFLP
ncbi:MAG: hypothetical protein KDJ87_07620 [Rhizobiaceae bacterium]|nr:hypothetical protein [Rhizobiaceae bacterium]